MTCPICGAPSVAHTKWNGGNPISVDYPTCACEETETDRRIDAMLAAAARRRAEQQ